MTIVLFIIGIIFVACIYETFFKSNSVDDIKEITPRVQLKKIDPNENTINKASLKSFENSLKKEENPVLKGINDLSKDTSSNTEKEIDFPLAVKERQTVNLEEILSILDKKFVSFNTFDSNGLPCYFIHNYYPLKYTDISEKNKENRKIIYNFKDGLLNDRTNNIHKQIAAVLLNSFSKDSLKETVFVCLPASTQAKYKRRYARFSEEVCKSCGMMNFFQHVSYLWDRKAKHIEKITAESELSHIHFPKEIVKNKNIIIFDDIFTTGKTLRAMESKLTLNGANVVSAIFLGKTYDQYGIKMGMLGRKSALIED